MISKLFTSKIFGIVFLIIVCFDLINSIMDLTKTYDVISILVLRYVNLLICLSAVVFFFVFTKYSLSILKMYLVFKLILFPLYIVLYNFKDYILYSATRFTLENYIEYLLSILFGLGVYYFFRKYKIEKCRVGKGEFHP